MSPKKDRPKRHRLKSTAYGPGGLPIKSGNEITVNYEYERELLKLMGEVGELSLKQAITRLCMLRGPWTSKDLQTKLFELGKPYSRNSISSALSDLVTFGALVKVNGGYAIVGWDK